MNSSLITSVSKVACQFLYIAATSAPLAAQEGTVNETMGLGVQTHFTQGWPVELIAKVGDVGAAEFRDGLRWNLIEFAPGRYNFESIAPFMAAAAQQNYEPLLIFHGTHPAYDDDQTPFTTQGRLGFANFVNATISAFPDQITKIEVGNEINAPNFTVGPYEDDPTGNYAQLINVVADVVKSQHPKIEIVCTGAHSVALAYFRALFEAGVLDDCDAISLHPYRPQPEGVDRELAELKRLMKEYGEIAPIYATEFGSWFDDPADAPDFLVKMVTLMAHADVEAAYWYALYDEPWWPNMGLFDKDSREKPAKAAFQFVAETLLPLGRARLLGSGGVDRIYAFGPDANAIVAWGAVGRLNVAGTAKFYNARGNEIPKPEMLSETPVIILGDGLDVTVTRDTPVYDSLLQFRQGPWRYIAATPVGPETELTLQESNWASYLGNQYLAPLGMSDILINGSIFNGASMYAIERFAAPATGKYEVTGRWSPTDEGEDGDGADIQVTVLDRLVASGLVASSAFELASTIIILQEGQSIDFAVGPHLATGGDVVRRRITVKGPLP